MQSANFLTCYFGGGDFSGMVGAGSILSCLCWTAKKLKEEFLHHMGNYQLIETGLCVI
jgi:hypothetical protein